MKYISLNHNSAPTSFRNAVINGLAPDKGLYFPEEEICLSKKLLESLYEIEEIELCYDCLLYTSPSPRDATLSRMPSSA